MYHVTTMDIDNKALISLVFSKRAIWDKQNKLHNVRNVTDKYWREISAELNQEEHKLRKRWRYLRDQFAIELGKVKVVQDDDDEQEINPKWPHFKSLLFLKSTVKPRLAKRRYVSDREDNEMDSQSVDNSLCESPPRRNTEDCNTSDQHVSKWPKNTPIDVENEILSYLQEKRHSRQNRTDTEHEHMLFFRSLLPHVEKIPRNKLLSFRSRIQNVVEEFAYES